MRFRSAFLFIWFIYSSVSAQQFVGVKNWVYQPVDSSFWTAFQIHIDKKDWGQATEIIEKKMVGNLDSMSGLEVSLAIASFCRAVELRGCAQAIMLGIIQVAPTSIPAMQSLIFFEKDQGEFEFDEEELSRIVNTGSFKEVPDVLVPMLNYYVALDNLKKAKPVWARSASLQIPEDSFWGFRIQFFNSLSKLGNRFERSSIKEAVSELEALRSKVEAYPKLHRSVLHQLARLYFELELFEDAEKIYKGFHFAKRDYGKALLERAWIRFFQKDYSVSLGLVESLKAPFFKTSLDPESYVLASLIYRDLCHYKSATETATSFEKRFQGIRNHVKKRLPLDSNSDLVRMAVIHPPFQGPADVLNSYIQDLEKLDAATSNTTKLEKLAKNQVKSAITRSKKELTGRLLRQIKEELKLVSDRVLDVSEQMKILDYVVKLDEFRIKSIYENRDYKTEKVEMFAINRLYWPSTGEFWWDELPNFRVLISDRCQAAGNQK